MENKIIFFDVDGTLVDVRPSQEYIPASTIEAVRLAQANGHKCVLCTGRSKAEIYPHILELGFDGIIGAGGGFVEYHDTMLYHHHVEDQVIEHVIQYFESHGFDYYVESNEGIFASSHLKDRLIEIFYGDVINDEQARQKLQDEPNHFIDALTLGQSLHRDDINKICFLENTKIPFQNIIEEFKDELNIIHCTVPAFGDESGELSIKDINKAYAIEHLLKHLNMSKTDTFAFGDGLNDIDMLDYCEVGIAVGNSKEKLKEIADYVCEDIADDGIYLAMKKYNLI